MALQGLQPMAKYGSGMNPMNAHTQGAPHAFATPSHGQALLNNSGQHIQNTEVRNPVNGIPHISMKPGA
jgi:hypothetical protein